MNSDIESSDIILITVDCWRDDATEYMDNMQEYVNKNGFQRKTVTTHAAATAWSTPSLLAGQHFPNVLELQSDSIQSSEIPMVDENANVLPQLLSEAGYETAAFIGDNPYLEMWEPFFDTWSNESKPIINGMENLPSKLNSLFHLGLQKKKAPASHLVNKALDWIEETDSPRFVWVHLMEPHGPYYAGLSEAWNNGLLKTYQTFYTQGTNTRQELVESNKYNEFRHQLQNLYNSTNKILDSSVVRLLSACSSDTKIYLTADHGEEFSDEWYGHSRPYDDCIKVPFYTNVDPTQDNISRHVEIASEILAQEEIKPPKNWKRAAEYSEDCSFIIHPSIHGYGQLFVGCRTPNYHYLQLRSPTDGHIENEELYQGSAFTKSKKDISEDEEKKTAELRQKVDIFIDDFEIDIEHYTTIGRGAKENVDENVSARLEELGYID